MLGEKIYRFLVVLIYASRHENGRMMVLALLVGILMRLYWDIHGITQNLKEGDNAIQVNSTRRAMVGYA